MSDEQKLFGFDLAADGDVSGVVEFRRAADATLHIEADATAANTAVNTAAVKLRECLETHTGRKALESFLLAQAARSHFGQLIARAASPARNMRRLRRAMETGEGGEVMDTDGERALEAGAQKLSLESTACRLSDDERARLSGGYWGGYPVGERDEPEIFYPRAGGRVFSSTLHTDDGRAPREVVTHVEPTTVYVPVLTDELLDSRFQPCPRCGASKFIGEVCQFCLDAGRVMLRDVGEVGFEAGGLRGRGRLLIGNLVDARGNEGSDGQVLVWDAGAPGVVWQDPPGAVETSPEAQSAQEAAPTEAGQGMSARARAACEIAEHLRETQGVRGSMLLRVRIGTTWAVSCDDLTFWPVKDKPKLSNADAMRAEVRRMAASDVFMPYTHDHINAESIEVICAR
jgi:hypothetical protein